MREDRPKSHLLGPSAPQSSSVPLARLLEALYADVEQLETNSGRDRPLAVIQRQTTPQAWRFYLYVVLSAVGIYLSYLSGLLVERWFGSTTSLLYFMLAFIVALVAAFPLAVMWIGPRGSRA